MLSRQLRSFCALALLLVTTSCSGGGGGDDSDPIPDVAADETIKWSVQAPVSGDTCGERISPVTQTFTVSRTSGALTVKTGLVTVPATETETGFTFGFDESNGTCVRSYHGEFSNIVGDDISTTAQVVLTASSTCDGRSCSSSWTGIGTAN